MASHSTGELGAKFAFFILVSGGISWLVSGSLVPIAVSMLTAAAVKRVLR